MLLSVTPKTMPLSLKERMGTVDIYYLNGQNAAQAMRVSEETMDYDECRALTKLYGT